MRPASHDISSSARFDAEAALEACARGDQSALKSLYAAESRRMLGMALRIVRTRERAEDVLHDAFIRIWRGAAGYERSRGEARGWMHTVLRHVALDHARRYQRDVTLDEDAEQAVEDEAAMREFQNATPPQERNMELGRLDGCLQTLAAPRRECVMLAYLDGCTHGEIAQRLVLPLGTVKAWIARSLKSLRECMG